MQKKRKGERAEILIENLRKNWLPSTFFELSEDDIDRVSSFILYKFYVINLIIFSLLLTLIIFLYQDKNIIFLHMKMYFLEVNYFNI